MNQNRKMYMKEYKKKAVELSYAKDNAKEIALFNSGIDKGLLYR